jgi:1,4-dihydroxy-2-naphthoate octaprenyltransferase
MTALSFEISGQMTDHLPYILFIGTATAALYCGHRVIGLNKLKHIRTSPRFDVIRQYKSHIWVYCVLWVLLSGWLLIPIFSFEFICWLIPGGSIAVFYVVPIFPGGKRLRDFGWSKIIMIGWSWGWLTAFLPFYFYTETSIQLAIIHGLERMLFIILITIPFEIRDIHVDRSLGLMTLPERIGKKNTWRTAVMICVMIMLFSATASFHFLNPSYSLAMIIVSVTTLPIIRYSYRIQNDYFFSGLTDGLMILALWVYAGINVFL